MPMGAPAVAMYYPIAPQIIPTMASVPEPMLFTETPVAHPNPWEQLPTRVPFPIALMQPPAMPGPIRLIPLAAMYQLFPPGWSVRPGAFSAGVPMMPAPTRTYPPVVALRLLYPASAPFPAVPETAMLVPMAALPQLQPTTPGPGVIRALPGMVGWMPMSLPGMIIVARPAALPAATPGVASAVPGSRMPWMAAWAAPTHPPLPESLTPPNPPSTAVSATSNTVPPEEASAPPASAEPHLVGTWSASEATTPATAVRAPVDAVSSQTRVERAQPNRLAPPRQC